MPCRILLRRQEERRMSEGNNMIFEAIKSLITEEQIDDAIRCVVRERFTYSVERAIKEEAESIARQYCDKKIEEVLADLFGKEVNLDDGFGGRREYKTFEEYVRDYVGQECRKQWNMERNVKRMIESRIEEVCKKVVAENEANLADQAIRILGGAERKEE